MAAQASALWRYAVMIGARVLGDEAATLLEIAARPPRAWLDDRLDMAPGGDREQAEAEQPAQFADTGIALAARRAHGRSDREPDLLASRAAVDPLEHELEIEGELQLADDDKAI